MKVLPSAILLLVLSDSVAFCQIAQLRDPQEFFRGRRDIAAADSPPAIRTFSLHPWIHAVRVTPDTTDSALLHELRFNSYGGLSMPARSRIWRPFNYTFAENDLEYFPIKVGPLRYTFWSGNSQSKKPAGGRLQNLIDGVLRHYTSDPVVPVNKRCLRSLSCNSPYEQTSRQLATQTGY